MDRGAEMNMGDATGRTHRLAATPETVHTGFLDNSLEPVLTIESGDTVSIETMMLMDGRLRPGITAEELVQIRTEYRSRNRSAHSLTGPIYVRGAEPGDVLEVRILRLVPYPYGVTFILPGETGAGTLPDEFPDAYTQTIRWQPGDTEVTFKEGVQLPLRPFMGVMAVAPPAAGQTHAGPPADFGGNIDLKELVEGTTLFLPVHVPGALFSTGDAHALQGDGEVSTTALESAVEEALLQFVVRRDMHLERPMAETPTHWITMGFHPDLDEAARIALRDAIDWLVSRKGLSREEAYSLCSLAVDMRITQLVDGNKGVHAMIPKSLWTN
jgi:acetamidase/formamidase